jgi:multicomponent K+:H+ antiporter subunit D
MLLEAAASHPWQWLVWAVVLGVGFLTLIGLARAGSILFWHVDAQAESVPAGTSPRLVAATATLLAATVALTVFAAPAQRYTEAAARQLQDREAYARAVLGPAGTQVQTTRPYRFEAPGAGR